MRGTMTAAALFLLAGCLAETTWAQEPAKPAAATAQATATAAPVVTEAKRREILRAAETLTGETFADVVRRAEAGDVEAQVLAAIALEEGKVVPTDVDRAGHWLRMAAEKDHPIAQNMLGNRCREGRGTPQDSRKAVEWYAKAAAQGYAQAQSNLGMVHFTGTGVPANPVEAVRLFRLAAEQDNPSGQVRLGLMYTLGAGVKKDLKEAAAWYRKAAEGGDASAQVTLGLAYYRGTGVTKNKTEAEKWYRKASEQGDAIGSFNLGFLYLERPGPGRTDADATRMAIDSLKLSAEQGNPMAAFVLGEVFSYKMFPYHVTKDDSEACVWYLIASSLDMQSGWEVEQPERAAWLRKDLPGRIDKLRKSLGAARYAECDRRASDWMAAHPQRRQE